MIEVIILWVIAHPLKMCVWKVQVIKTATSLAYTRRACQVSAGALFMTFVNFVNECVVVDF